MDKQATIGFVLIAVVLMVWMWLNTPPPSSHKPGQTDTTHVAAKAQRDSVKAQPLEAQQPSPRATTPAENFGEFFAGRTVGVEKMLVINTDLYTAEITTKGGLIHKWELRKFKTWNHYPVQMVDLEKGGDFSLLFLSKDGKQINTRNLYFDADFPAWKAVPEKRRDVLC